MRTYLTNETDPIRLQSALFDLRGGMMMDVSQANKLQNTGTDIFINEHIADTKKRFDSMISNPKMTALLISMGISSDDYTALIRSG